MCELVGERTFDGLLTKAVLVLETFGKIEDVLVDLPVAVAAVFPFREVLWVEGAPVELGGENGADLGERVEPFEDGFGLLAVLQTTIELLAEGVRETGDFSGTGGVHD